MILFQPSDYTFNPQHFYNVSLKSTLKPKPPIPLTSIRPPTSTQFFEFPLPLPTLSMESTPKSSVGDASSISTADTAFIIICTAFVWLMIPGVGFFYSGLARSKNSLSLILICFWCIAVVSLQWFVLGYSLTFSRNGSSFIGNFDHVFLIGVYDGPSPGSDGISDLTFCIFQMMFAAISCSLIIGASAERARFLPATVFILLWTTFVYDFIAYWTWNSNGWSNIMGGLDFAGGTPVHISSAAAALAYAILLGRRKKTEAEEFKHHNMSHVFLGTSLIWFGWFGFNGGSALSASFQAVNACVVTNLSASAGAITWVILDYRHERKYSPAGFCAGAVAGLVSITPACGFVSPASSILFGVLGALSCNIAMGLKRILRYDDALDVFSVHGVGAIVGNILTGIFAQKYYAENTEGGWIDGHPIQLLHQLIDTLAGFTWSFLVSFIILFVLNLIPGLRLRVSESDEDIGLDLAEHGFSSYEHVDEVRRHFDSKLASLSLTISSTVENEPPKLIKDDLSSISVYKKTLWCTLIDRGWQFVR